MPTPDEKLQEYEQSKRIRAVIMAELDGLPKGTLFRKNVNGKMVCYLENHEGGKSTSAYVAKRDVPDMEKKIIRRRQLQASISNLDSIINQYKKTLDNGQ